MLSGGGYGALVRRSPALLRVLTLATLFPDASRPDFGIFVERQTRALAAREGVEVQVVAPVGLPRWPLSLHRRYRGLAALPRHEDWRGLRVHRPRFPVLPGSGGKSMPGALARAILPLLRAVRHDFPFDVIDAEFFYPDAPAAMQLAARLGIPFSAKARGADIHFWGARPGCARQIVAAASAAGGLLAVSGALRDDMAMLGLPPERIRVHHTGVDLGAFVPRDRAAARQGCGIAGPLAVSVGALIDRKRHDLAIDAVARLPGVSLLIAGEGPERPALERQIARLRVSDRVRLLGAVPHAELPQLLQAADLFVLASRSEGLANAWVEAIACGVPIVAADVGGVRELVDRPEAGRIVPHDAGAIAEAMAALLDDPPSPAAVRAAALPFTWDANARALEAHLRAIAAAG